MFTVEFYLLLGFEVKYILNKIPHSFGLYLTICLLLIWVTVFIHLTGSRKVSHKPLRGRTIGQIPNSILIYYDTNVSHLVYQNLWIVHIIPYQISMSVLRPVLYGISLPRSLVISIFMTSQWVMTIKH